MADDGQDANNDGMTAETAPYIAPGTRNQNPAEGKLKGQTLRVKRVLVMVSDLQRSLDFYENVIGLEVYAVDQDYAYDTTAIGKEIFNTPYGTRRRNATLNTSAETRGIALREINAAFDVPQAPRTSTILFEASHILDVYERAKAAGATVIDPRLGMVEATETISELRYMEFAVIDPDGHTLAFYRYFTGEESAEWEEAKAKFKLEIEG
jgi:catechol 2,3-dioxygenase-like lactoylglutathione lyase family enzyme